jgi:hypothetical protein
MLNFMEGIKDIHPGIYVHSVYIEQELDKDRQAGFVRHMCCLSPGGLLILFSVWERQRSS